MNDAEYEQQVARLLALADQWVRPIGLGWWRVDLAYDRDGADFADSEVKVGGFTKGTTARCFADWRYGTATIVWNMPAVAHLSDDDLEAVFVHELMHVFLSEMQEGARQSVQRPHEERVASTLQKAFLWIRDRARDGEWGKSDA